MSIKYPFSFLSELSALISCESSSKKDSPKKVAISSLVTPEKKNSIQDNNIQRTVCLDGITISYFFCRSNRRTIGFLIDESGLKVTAPKRCPLSVIEKTLQEKKKWILNKLNAHRNPLQAKPAPLIWQEGTTFPYLGNKWTLHIDKKGTSRPVFSTNGPHLVISLSPHHLNADTLSKHLKKWLKTQARTLFAERLLLYAQKMKVQFDTFKLSSARTRWGACSAKRQIRLNWRLIHCDLALIDYVVIHELAHLCEMNHSPRFWAIVKQWYPDPKQARKKLQNLSPLLFSLFAETN